MLTRCSFVFATSAIAHTRRAGIQSYKCAVLRGGFIPNSLALLRSRPRPRVSNWSCTAAPLSSLDAPTSDREELFSNVAAVASTPEAITRMQAAYQILGDDRENVVGLVRAAFPHDLDDFQQSALYALANGRSVVLSAPTGAGKTVVGEMAVYLAMLRKGLAARVFYCTPLKALSNQKFYDFQRLFGQENVGLLTGDVTVNRDAAIVGTSYPS